MIKILEQVAEHEAKLKKIKSFVRDLRCLNSMETTEDFYIAFNQARCGLDIAVKYQYYKLVEILKHLRQENIYLEYRSRFISGDDKIFIYGDGIIQVWFYAKYEDVPEDYNGM